jgi:hypothetical protein
MNNQPDPPRLKAGQIIARDTQLGQTTLALVINVFPALALIVSLDPERKESLRPIILKENQVKGVRLKIDLFVHLLTLELLPRQNVKMVLGNVIGPKYYEIMRKIRVVIMGKVGWRSRI